ncbi:MAG: hypothetical protein HQL36_05250 [Alphaproteobacteria bacterium]|nr:hypothetical protein [Alphaproteobacteria bacterium]
MSGASKVISLRATTEDITLFGQAAEGQGVTASAWMRATLREAALAEVYGKGSAFPATPGETALLRAVLVVLQMVGRDVAEDDKRRFADKAARQIEKIKAGE